MYCEIMCEGHIYFLCCIHGFHNYALGPPYTFLYSIKLLKQIEVTVRILFSLNLSLQDSYLFIPVVNLITFFLNMQCLYAFFSPPPPKYNAIPKS